VATYGRIVEDFTAFLASQNIRLRRLGREDLQRYVGYLRRERHNAARSIRLKLQVIKAFLAYLANCDVPRAPRISLSPREFSYKVEQREAESLSEEQLSSLLGAVLDRRDQARNALEQASGRSKMLAKQLFAAQRDLALMTLLVGTGLRIGEALRIRLSDLDFVDRSILIHGKGKKLRKVFFDLEGISTHLLSYIGERAALAIGHDFLFVQTKAFAPLGSRGFQKQLKRYLQMAGLRASVSPHTLRHSFATVAIEKGANIKAVSQILGHANCKITIDLYTHLSSEHLRAVMQRCNPLSTEVIPIEERIEMRKKHLPYLDRTG
jgi:site-specific recombinase XerD